MPESSGEVRSLLVKLERELHDPCVRCNRARLAELLHIEFVEFARSGRSYSFSQVLAEYSDSDAQLPPSIHAQDFEVRLLGDALALVTYKSAHVAAQGKLEGHSLRSSLWQRMGGGWQVVFHQGTPTVPFAAAGAACS